MTLDSRLSETDRKLKSQFDQEYPTVFEDRLFRHVEAAPLYKRLAAFGAEKGWIKDPAKYPLMYPLLYSALDTAIAVEWRFRSMVRDDDKNHTGSFTLGMMWCVYVAMADAYYCQRDWDDLRKAGLVYKLEKTCGFNYVDDFVVDVFHIPDAVALRQHIVDLSNQAKLPFSEVDDVCTVIQQQHCLTAMYYYGIELAMQYMDLL